MGVCMRGCAWSLPVLLVFQELGFLRTNGYSVCLYKYTGGVHGETSSTTVATYQLKVLHTVC